MKLITKTILFYLLVSLPLLVIAAVISFFMINKAVDENIDESLWNEKRRAEAQINTFKIPHSVYLGFDSLASIRPDTTNASGYNYSNIYRIDPVDGEQINYRKLKSYYKSKGINYAVTIIKARLEEDDLVDNLLDALLITISFLVLAFFVINWIVSKTLWKPFYRTIGLLEDYDLKNNAVPDFGNPATKEFKQLNRALKKMTEKAHSDFVAQKEFTENAAHESQTPLAVIKARIDLLMQSPNLKENEMEQLQVIENAVTKLSGLNKGLLLLAKIENEQFKETGTIDLEYALNKILDIYSDLISDKNITLIKDIKGRIILKMNPVLCDILLSNLIQNAIRHNQSGGQIKIEADPGKLVIKNTGEPLRIDPERIFERFMKNDASKESLGLGLALAKSIAEVNQYKLAYAFRDGFHIFTLQF